MIDKLYATKIVNNLLNRVNNPGKVIEEVTVETNFCFIFFTQSKAYLEKGDERKSWFISPKILFDRHTKKMFNVGDMKFRTIWQDLELYRRVNKYELKFIKTDSFLLPLCMDYEREDGIFDKPINPNTFWDT